MLSLQSNRAFGVSFPVSEAIIVNKSDLNNDSVINGDRIAGHRTLSGVVTHERTHGLIRAEFGFLGQSRYPNWLQEGYCDAVAQESSLTADKAASLINAHKSVPALTYYEGRKRVERELLSLPVASLFERHRIF